jgi:hypothetical protein
MYFNYQSETTPPPAATKQGGSIQCVLHLVFVMAHVMYEVGILKNRTALINKKPL